MKILSALTLVLVLSTVFQVQAKEEKASPRAPAQTEPFVAQVQLCEGTAALGNEGQGMGASAFINFYVETDSQTQVSQKKCDLGFAFAYEYGNDRGLKIGKISPYNISSIPTGKTDCTVREENGNILFLVTKAISKNPKVKRSPKVLIENCRLTTNGF